jgi:hypothetical protein
MAYCDADYANDVATRRSVSGIVLMLNGGPVVWSTEKQKSISLSTTEAEFVAIIELLDLEA